jgi:hypothetical protein
MHLSTVYSLPDVAFPLPSSTLLMTIQFMPATPVPGGQNVRYTRWRGTLFMLTLNFDLRRFLRTRTVPPPASPYFLRRCLAAPAGAALPGAAATFLAAPPGSWKGGRAPPRSATTPATRRPPAEEDLHPLHTCGFWTCWTLPDSDVFCAGL